MTVWLLTVGEPLPTDGTGDRLLRAGLLAERLVQRGHRVIWWTSGFDHVRRRERARGVTRLDVGGQLRIRLLRARPYRRSVSLARIIHHVETARAFVREASEEPPPDITIASLPTLELCDAVSRVPILRGVPAVVDVRDLWPDAVQDLVPARLRGLARLPLLPWERLARRVCRRATAITGVTDEFVRWGLDHAGRSASALDRSFSMGFAEPAFTAAQTAAAWQWWTANGVDIGGGHPIVAFVGTMGHQFDFAPVLAAARRLAESRPHVTFVLCGDGDSLAGLRAEAAALPNVILPGWVTAERAWALLQRSVIGLAPYRPIANFSLNLANKPVEYMAAELAVVTSVEDGPLARVVRDAGCGATYDPADPDALARVIVGLVDEPGRLRATRSAARTIFNESFRADRVYDGMAGHLETIAGLMVH